MAASPRLLVLDVNETLSDLGGLRAAFVDVGLAEHEVEPWFAGVLRDGFALTLTGANPAFADLARVALAARLGPDGDPDAPDHVVAAFGDLEPHPDVADGLAALADAGLRIVTFSNGATSVARALLERAGAASHVERLLSVADAPAWKPDPRSYRWATAACGVDPAEAMLVAVHPWDVHGARHAGLGGAWIDRSAGTASYPAPFTAPDVTATSFLDLARRLTAEDAG